MERLLPIFIALSISIYIQVSEPWEMIGIDLMGPWKETKFGFKYLFTATEVKKLEL
jgi:hypothetical protein